VPRRLPPSPEQRQRIINQARGGQSAGGSTRSARAVTQRQGAGQRYVPPGAGNVITGTRDHTEDAFPQETAVSITSTEDGAGNSFAARRSVAIGWETVAGAEPNIAAVAIGYSAEATGDAAVAIGWSAEASGESAVAVGGAGNVQALGDSATAVGSGAYAGAAEGATAIGSSTDVEDGADFGTAVGANATVEHPGGLAVGSTPTGIGSSAGAWAKGTKSVALGGDATAGGDYSVALGVGATVDDGCDGAAAIGVDSTGAAATATASDDIVIGTDLHTVKIPGALEVAGVPITTGSGVVVSIVEGTGITVDDTDPANPIVSATGGGGGSGGVLAFTAYNPSTAVVAASLSSTSLADIDATNLAVTFTVPASGKVAITLGMLWADASSVDTWWGLRDGSTEVALCYMGFDAALVLHREATLIVTGLTAGASKTFKWAYKVASSNALAWYGDNGSTNRYGPASMLVNELP
jgi:hypothetical protein